MKFLGNEKNSLYKQKNKGKIKMNQNLHNHHCFVYSNNALTIVSYRDTQYLFSRQRYFIGTMRALIVFFVISLQSVIAKPSHLQNGIEKSNNELMIKVNKSLNHRHFPSASFKINRTW